MYNRKAIKLYEEASSLQQKGRLAEAERAYRKALKINGDFVEALNNLGNVLLDRGRLREAAESFARALKFRPDHPLLLRNLADALQLQGDNERAIGAYQKAISQDPGFAGAYINLGNSLRDIGRFREAISSYIQALEIDSGIGTAYYNLGSLLLEVNEAEDAVINFNKAIEIDPGHAEAYSGLGNALGSSGQTDEAIAAFRRAIAIKPEDKDAYHGLGNVLSDIGEIDEAIGAYRKALEIDPENADVYRTLANLRKFSEFDDDIRAMESLYAKEGIADEQRMYLAFGLGKAYEDLMEYEKSMDYILEGNRLKRLSLDYSVAESEKLFAGIKETFSPEFFAGRAGMGNPDETPVFILGMPRSGTSLVEQILASHAEVFGAGELRLLPALSGKVCAANASGRFPEGFGDVDAAAFEDLANEYIAGIRRHSTEARFITDKLPNNFLHIGVIRAVLPNARILHCTRDPMDNCLSIFKNYFAESLDYAYDMTELGRYYNLYRDLMEYWRQTLPGFVYDLGYEQLVADPESQIGALLEYCGLPWDDGCLNFHKTRRRVRTLSNAQVHRPIYRDSVELWRRYEKQLQPLYTAIYE